MAGPEYLARDAFGNLYIVPWPQAIAPGLSVSTQPSISGTVAPGQTVTAVAGSYIPSSGLTRTRRIWVLKNSSGVKVDEKNGDSYTIPSTAGTGTLTLTETMQASDGRIVEGTASASFTVTTGQPAFTVQPSIDSGGLSSVVVGTVLNANDGTVTGSPTPTKSRRWMRDGAAISGATGTSYTTVSADDGKTVTLEVTATNSAGTAVATSAGVAVYTTVSKPVFTVQPTISRNTTSGLLTASLTVTGQTSIAYRWYSADTQTGTKTAVSGATSLTWTPASSYAGKWISFQATATNGAGSTDSSFATPVQIPVSEGFTAQPAVTPSKAADWYPGVTVSTTDGTYSGSPTAKAYEWVVDGTLSTTLTASSFNLSKSSPGKKIKGRVKLTYASGNVIFSNYSTEVTVNDPPATSEGVPDYTVATAAELRTALIGASVGEVIACKSGDYGELNLTNIQKNNTVGDANLGKKSTYVWIRPVDRSDPPHVKGAVALGNSSGIIIDGLWIDLRDTTDSEAGTFKSEAYPDGAKVPATSNKGVTFNKRSNPSGSAGNGSNANSYGGGRRIIVTNCLIQFAHRAVEFQSGGSASQPHSADVWFIGNEITELGMDAANIFRSVKRLRWENNLIHRGHVATTGVTDTRHPDFLIQIDTFPAWSNDQNEDHTIMYNWCEAHVLTPTGGQPPDTHGTYVGHTVLRGTPNDANTAWDIAPENISASNGHKNIRFVNNLVDVPDANGISGQGFWGGEISRNKFLPWPRNGSKKPLVYMSLPNVIKGASARTASQLYGNGFKVNDNTTYASAITGGDGKAGATTSGNVTGVTSEDTDPPGWVALSKSNSRQTSNSFKGPQATPSGTCGRYRAGWASFLT